MNAIKILHKFFTEGNKRSLEAKLNVMAMLIIKGLSILLQFALLPLTVSYVSSSTYGIWLSLSSIVAWMSFFDIGINNGLKNRYVQAKANGNIVKAKGLVSTTYAFLACIFVPVALIGIVLNQFVDWNALLKVSSNESLNNAVTIIIVYFASNFIFSTINVVMTAEQKPAYASIINLLQQLLTYIVILILTKCTEGTLLNLCLALCLSPLFVLLIYNVLMFSGKYRHVSPSIKYVNFAYAKDLFTLGMKFFVIQMAVIILFQSSNFIMIRYYGPDAVTQYNVSYKLFFALNMVFTIMVTPVWAAVTDALSKNEIPWIQNAFKKYLRVALVFMACAVIMLFLSKFIYKIWMGDTINDIPFELSLCLCLYVCSTLLGSLSSSFLNGAGILYFQFINCLIAPILFIAIVMIFIKVFNMGVYSVPLAIIISSAYSYIIGPLQCYLVFFKNTKGLWAK